MAVGEIGLDYYWDKENHEKQIYWFERQLEVAREEKLPFIIHSRDAAKDTLDTMKRFTPEISGVWYTAFLTEKRWRGNTWIWGFPSVSAVY